MLFTKFNMMAEIQAECVLQRIILFKDRVLRTEIWRSEKVRQNSNNVSQTDSHVSVLKDAGDQLSWIITPPHSDLAP